MQLSRAGGWSGAELEYDYPATVAPDNGAQLRLTGASTPLGRVDWFAFDIDSITAPVGSPALAGPAPAWEVAGAIPSPIIFAGMPNPRWWQLEGRAVSLGHLQADTTDIAKLIVTEFALVYGNNWLCIPHQQRVGTLAEIAGIVVTDVFGERTLVKSATGSAGNDWSAWNLSAPHRPAERAAGIAPFPAA